jgi:hypothetical protein
MPKSIRVKKFIILSCAIFIVSAPSMTYAAWPVTVVTDASVTSIKRTIDSTAQWLKSFTLDRLATLIAKQMLHQMTASVVNWINSGFNGSPAFLTNPGAFFLDVGDQVTGAFLSSNGPLSGLCSPFASNIRINLAYSRLNTGSPFWNARYRCTLSTVVDNFKSNGVNVSVNAFQKGDFYQGGWPMFISTFTEPQNNYYGASYLAQEGLQQAIDRRQAAIQQDRQMGNGFLSYKKCTPVPKGTEYIDEEGNKIKSGGFSNDFTCTIETPGKVIAETLQKQLNVPADELLLADSINSIINALVNQMVTKAMSGLASLSSGGGSSYTSQLYRDATSDSSQGIRDARAQTTQALSGLGAGSPQQYKAKYDQAVQTIVSVQTNYQAVRACLANKISTSTNNSIWYSINNQKNSQLNNDIAAIDLIVATKVTPLLNQLLLKQAEADKMVNGTTIDSTNLSAQELYDQTSNYTYNLMSTTMFITQEQMDQANADLQDAQYQSRRLNGELSQYQDDCYTSGNRNN